jgi:hypothetical protein
MEAPTRRRGRALALGLAAALGTGLAWALLSAVLGLHIGLVVVAAFGGWLIGGSVRSSGPGAQAWAIGLALLAWLVGSVLEFVIAQLLLPAASTPPAARLTISGYLDYLAGTFDIIAALAIALLVFVAWRSAR